GANLTAEQQARLKQINGELASLGTQFGQNVLNEKNDLAVVVDNKADLAGLPDDQIAAAVEAAKARKLEGKYVLPLMNFSQQPQETYLQNRALRQKLQEA